MKKKDIDKFDKQIKLTTMLGAKQFKKLTLLVEKIKFNVVDFLFDDYVAFFEKHLDKKLNKKLKKLHSEEGKQLLINRYKGRKLLTRKVYHRCKNNNYHIDDYFLTDIIKSLEWNKAVHVASLKRNAALFLPLLFFALASVPGFSILLAFDVLSAFVNFQCINLQNYNIARISKHDRMKKLKMKQEKRINSVISEVGPECIKRVINVICDSSGKVPSPDEIIANIKTPEEAAALKNLILAEYKLRQSDYNSNSVKKGK